MLIPEPPLISLERAGVERAGRWLVRGIDLTIRKGEIVTLIGPNGSGKSTTAKIALGVVKPDEGSAHRKPGLCVGYVPQKLSVDWTLPLTVGRFMYLTGGVSAAAAREALKATGISHLVGSEVRNLSGGEFQRAMLARAIARKPDLLVLDEPVQGVDYGGEARLYQLIGRIRKEHGCAVLMVSHDIHVVMAESDRVLCINRHVCCEGVPETVKHHPEYVRMFGPAAEVIGVYTHRHDHAHEPSGEILPLEGEGHEHRH